MANNLQKRQDRKDEMIKIVLKLAITLTVSTIFSIGKIVLKPLKKGETDF